MKNQKAYIGVILYLFKMVNETLNDRIHDIEMQKLKVTRGCVEVCIGAGLGIVGGALFTMNPDIEPKSLDFVFDLVKYGTLMTSLMSTSIGLANIVDAVNTLYKYAKGNYK